MQDHFDVVIVGAAVVGSAAAYFLARDSGFGGSVLLLERDLSFQHCATTLSVASIRHQFSVAENVRMSMFGTTFVRSASQQLAVDGVAPDLAFREAGYLFLASVVFGGWAMAVFVFDKRSYIIFSPGQIKVCEQIGGREKVYDTTGMTIDKLRDDWFRHIFLGFGSGDLSVRTAGADRHEIVMPNVALIGFKIGPIEQLLRERQTTKVPS